MITLYETLIEAAKELNHSELVRFLINEKRDDVDKLFDLAAVKYTELSNSHKPVVSGKQPTTKGIRAVATRYANKNKTDKHLSHYDLRTAFIRGVEWYKSFTAACASSGEAQGVCADCGRNKDEDGACYSCEYGAMFGH